MNPLKVRTLSRAFSNGSIFVLSLSSEAKAIISAVQTIVLVNVLVPPIV